MVDSIGKKSYESGYKSGFIKTVWAVLTVLLLLAVFAMPASADVVVSTSQGLIDAINNASVRETIVLNAGTYEIYSQIVISDKNLTLKPASGANAVIKKRFADETLCGGIFKVTTADGKLILDGTGGGSSSLTLDGDNQATKYGGLIYIEEGAELVMLDGVTLKNGYAKSYGDTTGYGGAVMSWGKDCLFSMYGGNISNNYAGWTGSAVVVFGDSTFNMYDGIIGGDTYEENNTGARGAVDVQRGKATFNMYGGKISHNNVTEDGGGVKCHGFFNMYGGEISYNNVGPNTHSYGGGVYVHSHNLEGCDPEEGPIFNMYGGTISNNTAEDNGGGVFSGNTGNGHAPVINIYNGTISYNKADSGGGVYADAATELNIYSGNISYNKAINTTSSSKYGGGGVCIVGYGGSSNPPYVTNLNIYGGNISDNEAVNNFAGGVLIINKTISTMHGGTISNNSDNAVYFNKDSSTINFKMYGGTISNSTASPDVMKVEGAGTIDFKMYGGIIIGERTGNYGDTPYLVTGNAVNEDRNLASGFNNKSDGTGIDMSSNFVDSKPIYTIYNGGPAGTKTVSFNGNGGSGSTDSITIPSATTLTSNGFGKTGYSFDVWKQQRTGIRFIDIQPITYTSFGSDVSGTDILDAQWKPDSYTITYEATTGGSIIGPGTSVVIYDSIVRSMPKASKPGYYRFDGWNTSEGNPISSSTRYNFIAGDTTLYANYTGNITTLNFTTYGTTPQTDINVNYDSLVVGPITPPTNPGYNFSGYFIGDNATGKQLYKYDGTVNTSLTGYTDASGKWTNSSLPHGSILSLHANWTANVVTLNFTTYSASIQTDITATYNETKLVYLTIPTNSGYNFGGYFIGDNATGKQLYNETGFVNTLLSDYVDASGNWTNSSIVNGETVYLFAKWTATPAPAPTSPAPTSTPTPTPTSTSTPKPTQPVSSGGSGGVYGGYLTYEVFFDSMGGSNVDSISNLLNGAIIKEPVPPTKDGNTFDGWYTKEGHKWDFPTDTVTKTLTLYAKWTSTSASTPPVSTGASTTEQTNSPLGLVGLGLGLLGAAAILRRK